MSKLKLSSVLRDIHRSNETATPLTLFKPLWMTLATSFRSWGNNSEFSLFREGNGRVGSQNHTKARNTALLTIANGSLQKTTKMHKNRQKKLGPLLSRLPLLHLGEMSSHFRLQGGTLWLLGATLNAWRVTTRWCILHQAGWHLARMIHCGKN